jgi:hypothetical protein
MVEGKPGTDRDIIEFIVRKEMSSMWIHINWTRKQNITLMGMLFSAKTILPP